MSISGVSLAAKGRVDGGLWSKEGRSGEEKEGQREREEVTNCTQGDGPPSAGEEAEAERGSLTYPGHTADKQGSWAAAPSQPGPRAPPSPALGCPRVPRALHN